MFSYTYGKKKHFSPSVTFRFRATAIEFAKKLCHQSYTHQSQRLK